MTFSEWVSLPENHAGRLAAEDMVQRLAARNGPGWTLFLHGPSGTGKTHLVGALAAAAVVKVPDLTVCVQDAGEVTTLLEGADELKQARAADLLIIEDLQHLPARVAGGFSDFLDRGLARRQQQVFTASVGPARLTHLPARLTGRLSAALVVGLEPLGRDSRRKFLAVRARGMGLRVEEAILDWLAGQVPGSARQLEGALRKLEALARLEGPGLTVEGVAEAFRAEVEASRPTVQRIAEQVGRYFRIDPRQLQTRHRRKSALLPRQVSMYLARRLTGLSLQQIGAYFGGHDHSTVLHACRKIEKALTQDANLSGAVRRLHTDLT
jgi:chromosomal replication initiator protein